MNKLGLFDVVPLRHRAAKRPRDEVMAAVPLRGTLCMIDVAGPIRRSTGPMVAELFDFSATRPLLPSLDEASFGRAVSDDEFLVTGYEEVQTGRRIDRWPQVWWCRRASGDPPKG